MDIFIKASGGVLITLVLSLVLVKQGKDISLLLTVASCCMIALAAMQYLIPVIEFFEQLQIRGQLDPTHMKIILRAVGIGVLAEITSSVCSDAGNAALGKILQLVACVVVLWMSVPLFTSVIELVEEIMVSV